MNEPSFGPRRQDDDAGIREKSGGINLESERRPPARASRSRRKSVWLRLLLLACIGGAAGYGMYRGIDYYRSTAVDIGQIGAASAQPSGASAGDAVYARPELGEQLEYAQLLWCQRQQLRIAVLGDSISTNSEFRVLSSMSEDMATRCDVSGSDPALVAQAIEHIAANEAQLTDETIDQQLVLLHDGQEATWTRTRLVEGIQSNLARLGYDVDGVDGLYGRKTQAAIKAFQIDAGLEPTGKVDEKLLAQLERTGR